MAGTRRAQVREVIEAVELSPVDLAIERADQERAQDTPLDEPVTFYNPMCPNERFRLPGSTHFVRFAAGKFEAQTELQKAAAIKLLSAYGRGKADRWMGDDRERPWLCKKCGFISRNEAAVDDHRERGI